MRQKKIVLDGALCFILLRLCYNRLREEWYPGGYPPRAEGSAKLMQHMPGERSPAGKRLLQVVHLTAPLTSPLVSIWTFPLDLPFGPSLLTFPLHWLLPLMSASACAFTSSLPLYGLSY